ncbi:MAG: hypothetical protein IT373_01305 [Polyangiaceae bacterium]|nr:hypothetical protein [Polyangiaceae bacterium]
MECSDLPESVQTIGLRYEQDTLRPPILGVGMADREGMAEFQAYWEANCFHLE